MKIFSTIKFPLIIVFLALTFFLPVKASVDSTLQESSANTLVRLDLLKGYEDGTLRLQDNIKRSEFITLIVRMMGYDGDDISNVNISFKDIDKNHWAYDYIKAALKYNLVTGYPDNTIAPNNNVTYAEALAVVIRSLGYENTMTGKWPENVINKSIQLGISKDLDLPQNKQITRGEMSLLVNNSLTVDFAD